MEFAGESHFRWGHVFVMNRVPSTAFIVIVGLLLIGLGINGLRTGTVLGRIGSVQRATNPVWFWFRVTLYLGLGVLALCDAWRRDG